MDPIRAEAIRTLYVQARNSTKAAAVVTLYMLVTAWPYNGISKLGAWLAVQLISQVVRGVILRRFAASPRTDAMLEPWARGYTVYMAVAGLIWGSTAFLFIHTGQPITIALTLCGLYGISSGSVPGNAYNPPGLIVFVGGIFACVAVRLIAQQDIDLAVLAIASSGYAVILMLFNREQHRTIVQGIQIRFENRELLAELTRKTRQAEDALTRAEQANLAKSQFLAAASHDLRQPLYALSLFSASLDELKLDAEGRQVVGNIQDSIAVMDSLFEGLLDVSKLEAGVVQPRPEPVSTDAVFDRLSQYFRPVALERGLDLRFRSNGEWVRSDAALLEQILSNLVSNALRNTERGGVLVAARARAGQVRFEVWDTGKGIPPADCERIFEEFVQLGNPERDRRKGLGLGLAITRRAASLLETQVAVSSRLGRGSRFSVVQPASEPPAMPGWPVIVTRPTIRTFASRLRDLPVLVVDDDRDVRVALGDLLARWAVRFDAVADADAAILRVAEGGRYGLILTDYRLSGETDGLALIAELLRHHPEPKPAAVLITGDCDSALLGRAHACGVPLLHKPVSPADLRGLLGLSQAAAVH